MSIEVKVGQVWRDKDKRRNTVIEIIDATAIMGNVKGLIVGTEIEKEYKVERLVKRWDLVSEKLVKLAEKLGEFPHAAIRQDERPSVQKTYMLKVLCPHDEDYFVRMTQKKLDGYGAPICPCHNAEMEVEEK